jgi:hypothetical protein
MKTASEVVSLRLIVWLLRKRNASGIAPPYPDQLVGLANKNRKTDTKPL